ncbi:hypothetical protein B9Z19DRAFT_1137397 [Tuber borchii]|uniref:Uncharacterized protein n=1 Tax=Tuber borchii TaxID=42251 RepID=A0A2T6ZAH9_TUBBO|nr:hypothetical protein B9Z19DRAFT_1137397 [Tuber borchii]
MSAGKEIDKVDLQPPEVEPAPHSLPVDNYSCLRTSDSSEESTATMKPEQKINSNGTNDTETHPHSPTALERTAAKLAETRLSSIMINNEHINQALPSYPEYYRRSKQEDYAYYADDESPYNRSANGKYRKRTNRKKSKKGARRPKARLWAKNAANRESSPESLH